MSRMHFDRSGTSKYSKIAISISQKMKIEIIRFTSVETNSSVLFVSLCWRLYELHQTFETFREKGSTSVSGPPACEKSIFELVASSRHSATVNDNETSFSMMPIIRNNWLSTAIQRNKIFMRSVYASHSTTLLQINALINL